MDEYRCGIQEKLHEIDGQLKEHEALMNAVSKYWLWRTCIPRLQQCLNRIEQISALNGSG